MFDSTKADDPLEFYENGHLASDFLLGVRYSSFPL